MAQRRDPAADGSDAADGQAARRADGSVDDALALLGDPEPFEAVVEGDGTGPLAVVSDPYAGRERLLDYAADRLDASRVRLTPGDDATRISAALEDGGPVVVDDCQHLYRRVVGGFEPLETALDLLATADGTVVTGWNRYAWAYLTAVRTVEPVFPSVAEVGPVAPDRIAELVLSEYDDLPAFEADGDGDDASVGVERYEFTVGGRTVTLPLPRLDMPEFGATQDDDIDPQDVVFERLAAAAGGNVGVAAALWERRRGDVVRPSDLAVPDGDFALDREGAFCLRVLVAKERLRRDELDAVVGNTDRILAPLVRNDVVSVDGETVRLSPAAVPTAVERTEQAGIL